MDVGAHEIIWPEDGSIHVALRREVENGSRFVSEQTLRNQLAVADVPLHERIARIRKDAFEISWIPGIGQLVQIYDSAVFALHPVQDEVGADKSRSTGDQDRILHAQQAPFQAKTPGDPGSKDRRACPQLTNRL